MKTGVNVMVAIFGDNNITIIFCYLSSNWSQNFFSKNVFFFYNFPWIDRKEHSCNATPVAIDDRRADGVPPAPQLGPARLQALDGGRRVEARRDLVDHLKSVQTLSSILNAEVSDHFPAKI
jgi:hypothetical protein